MAEMRFSYRRIPPQLVINKENGLIHMGPHVFRRIFEVDVPDATWIARSREIEAAFETIKQWCRDNLDDQINWTFEGYHTVLINRDADAVRFRMRWC
jgi:hypothetical protein